MTLLVLGLVVPTFKSPPSENELWYGLVSLAPHALVYAMSFMTLGIFWLGQGTQLSRLARSNRHYQWIQLAFVFSVTLVPFSPSRRGSRFSIGSDLRRHRMPAE